MILGHWFLSAFLEDAEKASPYQASSGGPARDEPWRSMMA